MTSPQEDALSDAQLEIMQEVWERGETTVAEVWKSLSARRSLARNTIQTMMTRLEEKGWLRHRSAGKTFYYTASRKRAGALGSMLNHLVDRAFDGSVEALMLALVEERGLTSEEAKRIRTIIRKTEEREA